ncbi:hypothetical protein PHMEG_00011187 [Phytophthora megakarya]|uniref:Eukaryotic/viral aspartic protease n=1 Tax=Phytophthora megakarya TaxID=4795 RepID=A0A225WCC2_9STRA|nr:hypothetical protein PHMEG_00011187 [Phytophthora megakarya]
MLASRSPLDVWIGNIGEGVNVLLGMNFMYSAGVRLCVREGVVKLPDEENVVMYGDVPWRFRTAGMCEEEPSSLNMDRPTRSEKWSGPDEENEGNVWIDSRTALAWIVVYGHFPKEPGFVRPGKTRCKEWHLLILKGTESRQGRMRVEHLEQLMRLWDPSGVSRPKLLVRPKSQDAEVRIMQLQERLEVVEVFLAARCATIPKTEANTLGVEDLADDSMKTFAEETGEVDTRDVGTQVNFPRSCGCGV